MSIFKIKTKCMTCNVICKLEYQSNTEPPKISRDLLVYGSCNCGINSGSHKIISWEKKEINN